MKTNPAYAALAYKKAIISHVTNLLKTEYTTAFGDEVAQKKVLCEDVFREDAEVPEDELFEFIADLELQGEEVRLELAKFEFVRKEDVKAEPQAAPHPGSTGQARSPKGRQGRRKKGSRKKR